MPIGYYISTVDAAPLYAPVNATRPMAIGDPLPAPVPPLPDAPAIVTVPVAPFSDSTLGGRSVTFGALGPGFYYPAMDRLLTEATVPAGFDLATVNSGSARATRQGLVLQTAGIATSSATFSTNASYEYGADYAHFDVTIDAENLGPPTSGLTGPVDVARLGCTAADGSTAYIRVARDPGTNVGTGNFLVEGAHLNSLSVIVASGATLFADQGPRSVLRLRLVRNGQYVFGLIAAIDAATGNVISYVNVFETALFPTTAGPINFGVSNRATTASIRTRFTRFQFRPCLMVVPTPGLGGRAALFIDVFHPTRWRIVGTVPAALYSLRDLGVHDLDVFGVWGRSRQVGALEYVLPNVLAVGETATQTLVTPTDQALA